MSKKITKFHFSGVCNLVLEHTEGESKSKHVATEFFLNPSNNISRKEYVDEEGLPTEAGFKVLVNVFTQGLVGCITAMTQHGYARRDDLVQLVHDEMERSLQAAREAQKGYMTTDQKMSKKNTMTDLVDRLQELNQEGRYDELIQKAKAGAYHDYKSESAAPKVMLVKDLYPHEELRGIIAEITAGAYDEPPDDQDRKQMEEGLPEDIKRMLNL